MEDFVWLILVKEDKLGMHQEEDVFVLEGYNLLKVYVESLVNFVNLQENGNLLLKDVFVQLDFGTMNLIVFQSLSVKEVNLEIQEQIDVYVKMD